MSPMLTWRYLADRYQLLPGWQRYLLEAALIIGLLLLVMQWNSRHLLSSGTSAPVVERPLLSSAFAAPQTLDWSQSPRTLVYFFAPWCGICRVSMPGLNTLNSPDLRIVAIALDWQNTDEIEDFVEKTGFNHPVLLGQQEDAQKWNIKAYPTYYVINQSGEILHRDVGLSTPPGLWLRTL
jgi:thiol-disulfide isomerase/thioredoxin